MNKFTLAHATLNVNGASFVGLDTLTQVKLKGGKANPQQGRITKRMTGAQVMVFQNKNVNGYEAMIRRRLVAEGKNPDSFQLGERAWGVRIPNMPIVEHKGEMYLEVIFLKPGNVEYLLDGQPINQSNIIGLEEPNVNPNAQGGLDENNRVIIRTFAADSITELRIDGKVFN